MNSVFGMLLMAGSQPVPPVPQGSMLSGTRNNQLSQVEFTVTEHDNTTHKVIIDDSYGTSWEWDNPSGWNIKKIRFTGNGLGDATSSIVLSGDWSTVTDMSYMFYNQQYSSPSITIDSIDTSNVTDMTAMFYLCRAASLTINPIDTSNVTKMSDMFYNCSITSLDLSGLNVSNVTLMNGMFGYSSLTSINISGWDTANVIRMNGMFQNCTSLTKITGIEDINVSNVIDMSNMFGYCQLLTQNESRLLDLSKWKPTSSTSLSYAFSNCKSLYNVKLFSSDKCVNITNVSDIFAGCNNLRSIFIDGITCERANSFVACFNGCSSLTTLDIRTIQTSQVVSDQQGSRWIAFLGGVNGCNIYYDSSLWNSDIVDAFPDNNWNDVNP